LTEIVETIANHDCVNSSNQSNVT